VYPSVKAQIITFPHDFASVGSNIPENTTTTTKISLRITKFKSTGSDLQPMTNDYSAINTLVLVEHPRQAEQIAHELRNTGIAVQQSWVSTAGDFSQALQRESFDLVVMFSNGEGSEVPATILRYPDIAFLAVMDKYRNRVAEELLEFGVSEVAGLSHPVRLNRVLQRLLSEARLKRENRQLRTENEARSSMLQTLLQSTAEPVAYIHQGMHSYGNSAYRNLIGSASATALEQTPLLDIIAGDDREMVAERLRDIEQIPTGISSVSTRLLNHHGKEVAVALHFTRSWYDTEPVLQMIVSAQEEADPVAMLDAFESSETIVVDPLEHGTDQFDISYDDTLMIDTIAISPELLPTVMNTPTRSSTRPTAETAPVQTGIAVSQIDHFPNPIPGITLELETNSITSLRSDGSERHILMPIQDVNGIRGLQQDVDSVALDSWMLDQAIVQIQSDPGTGIFVRMTSSHAELLAVIDHFSTVVQTRQVPRRGITLIIDAGRASEAAGRNRGETPDSGAGTVQQLRTWRELIDLAHATGFGICLRCSVPEDGFQGAFAELASAGTDYLMLTAINASTSMAMSEETTSESILLKQCQQRSIRSIAEIDDEQSISRTWALGFDCFVIQPRDA